MTFFESDDEKWMTGDFDLDLDVDLGRPIDFEADESVTNQDDSGFQDANSSGNAGQRKGTPSISGPAASASVQRSGAPPVPGHNNNVNNIRLGCSTNGNSVRGSGGSHLANSTSTGINPDGNGGNGNGNKGVSFQPLPNVRSSVNGNGGKTNSSNSTSSVQPSGSGDGKPSPGGFSFPPGVVRVYFYFPFFLYTTITRIITRTSLG